MLHPATRKVIRTARLAEDDESCVGTDIQKSRKDDGEGRLGHAATGTPGRATHSGPTSDRGRLFRSSMKRPSGGPGNVAPDQDRDRVLRARKHRRGAGGLQPRLAKDPHRRAVRMLIRSDQRQRTSGETLGSGHRPDTRRRAIEIHHDAVLPADAVRCRGQMEHSPQLEQHQRRRAQRQPPRECACCAHQGPRRPAVLAHARCGRNGRCLQKLLRADGGPIQGETVARSSSTVLTSGSQGSTTWKVAPCPGVLSTNTEPPWASTIRREM